MKLFFLCINFLYKIDWSARLIGIVWQRWIGKTTILLQYLKKENILNFVYFSADNIALIEIWIYKIVEKLYLENWIKTFFIDEIHKSQNWNFELKNLYDDFPNIKIVFSGSSSIDLIKWKLDLSRRVLLYKMKWFSLKEFINKKEKLKKIIIFFSLSKPWELSINSLKNKLGIS